MSDSVSGQLKLLEDFSSHNPDKALVLLVMDGNGKLEIGTSNLDPQRLTEFLIEALYQSQMASRKIITGYEQDPLEQDSN